jgi:hypothetical protein
MFGLPLTLTFEIIQHCGKFTAGFWVLNCAQYKINQMVTMKFTFRHLANFFMKQLLSEYGSLRVNF